MAKSPAKSKSFATSKSPARPRPPSPPPAAIYYVLANEQEVGPLTLGDFIVRIKEGGTGGGDLAWKEGMAEWAAVETFKEFAEALTASGQPPAKKRPPPTKAEKAFAAELADCAAAVEAGIGGVLGSTSWRGTPETLAAAMQHGALGGGKRIRPLLVRQAAQVFGNEPRRSLATQIAVELVHCYSLIHDDLPAMDNDAMRRGRPSVHKEYGEAAAILAGDALLTLAFGWLADSSHGDPEVRAKMVVELADAAGSAGMVGGQMRDIAAETNPEVSDDDIALMQEMKTGRLIRAAVRMGAISAGADDDGLEAITRYGDAAGRAFQLGDDLLDVTSNAKTLGKAAGKDAARGKQTMVGRIGVEAAQRQLGEYIHHAIEALSRFGPEADGLRATARYFATRDR